MQPIPPPTRKTQLDVQEMFDKGFFQFPPTPFWDGSKGSLISGTPCLVSGVGAGMRANEVFHYVCYGWARVEDRDMVIIW